MAFAEKLPMSHKGQGSNCDRFAISEGALLGCLSAWASPTNKRKVLYQSNHEILPRNNSAKHAPERATPSLWLV